MSNITFWDHIFFLLIGVLIPVLSLLRGKVDMEHVNAEIMDKKKFYLANAGVLWVGAALVFILWLLAGRPFSEMGISPPYIDLLVIGLTILFIVAYVVETVTELNQEGKNEEILQSAPFLPQNNKEFLSFAFLAFSAGICEEIVYRGFLVSYLMTVIGDSILAFNVAVIFPAVIFGVVHMYQGPKSVMKIAIMSLLFSTIFIFSQSLLIVVVLHIAVDMVGGFLGMKIAQSAATATLEEEE
jgi:membrane protease YdiL (CAAX protease family)